MSQHRKKDSTQFTQNQNNRMSEDPHDGSRDSFVLGRDGKPTPVEQSPEEEEQDQAAIESYGRRGAGRPAKD